jgi:DNA excision repair protein ERCC-4
MACSFNRLWAISIYMKNTDEFCAPPIKLNPTHVSYIPSVPKDFIISVDTREQKPYKFGKIPVIVKTINAGDYSINGMEHLVSIERKSQADFYGTITGHARARFYRMLDRLDSHLFKGLIIECEEIELLSPETSFSEIHKNSVYSTIISFEIKRGLHVYYGNRRSCAIKIANWLLVFYKNYLENNKNDILS